MADATYQPKLYRKQGGAHLVVASGGALLADVQGAAAAQGIVMSARYHVAIADVNAGVTLVPIVAGLKYRLVDCAMIAIGATVTTLTSVDLKGTQSASVVVLVSCAQASLVRSTVLRAGATGSTVLADGASFATCDVGTAFTLIKAGSDGAAASHIDVLLTYAVEV